MVSRDFIVLCAANSYSMPPTQVSVINSHTEVSGTFSMYVCHIHTIRLNQSSGNYTNTEGKSKCFVL